MTTSKTLRLSQSPSVRWGKAEGQTDRDTQGRKEGISNKLVTVRGIINARSSPRGGLQFKFKSQKAQSSHRSVPRRRIWAIICYPTKVIMGEFISWVDFSKWKASNSPDNIPLVSVNTKCTCFYSQVPFQVSSPEAALPCTAGQAALGTVALPFSSLLLPTRTGSTINSSMDNAILFTAAGNISFQKATSYHAGRA